VLIVVGGMVGGTVGATPQAVNRIECNKNRKLKR